MTQSYTAPVAQSAIRREVLKRGCEFKDLKTGRVCGGKYQAQVDLIKPKSLGGTDDLSNLRCLCRKHNLLEAQKVFGRRTMNRYWKN